ncbi:MAG: SMI1/KNR4 family protein [Terricaulis sp.]
MGYSQAELEDIQDRWRLRFPPDLVELMRSRRPLMRGGLDWLKTSSAEIQRILEWPFEGLWFDVREADLWWPEWGEKPKALFDQGKRLGEVVTQAPKLIPLDGHRYLPETPNERGNPVFSVYQSDVIYYGADLADWIVREERGWEAGRAVDPARPPREIPFWSEIVRRNG